MGKETSAPAPPNYTAAAQAQGVANVETARAQGRMNNPNVFTPYGNQTVTWGGGSPQFNQSAYDQAMQQYNTALAGYNQGGSNPLGWHSPDATGAMPTGTQSGPAPVMPTREQFTTEGISDQPNITQTLSPANQALLDAQNRIGQNLAGVAESGLGRVAQGMGESFDTSRLPGLSSYVGNGPYTNNVNAPSLQTGYDQGGQVRYDSGFNQPIQNSFNAGGNVQQSFDTAGRQQGQLGDVGGPQRGLDFSGAPGIPGINDFGRERDQVTNALLSRSEPQFQRDEELTRTRLINQGIAPGAEASNYDLDTLNRARNDARMQATLAGSQEQSRLANLAMAARGQYTGEQAQQGQFANNAQNQAFTQGLAGGQFANQAQQAQYGQNLGAMQANNAAQAQQYAQNQGLAGFQNAAQAQGYGQAQGNLAAYNAAQGQANQQGLAAGQFANQAAQGNFGMGQQNAALNNQVMQQQFQQGLANANLSNQGRQQQIQEQAYLRSLPLNELNALRTGAQVQNPQFQPYQGVEIGQTPVFGAAQAQATANQNAYNQQVGADNAFTGGLFSLGTGVAGAPWAGKALGKLFGW